jgi:DNA polymerase-3 subunit alpha
VSYSVLHCHSMYSLLDGLSKPEQIAKRCNNLGIKTCAITDHGTISGTIKFYSTMKKHNIKPILGCELYICKQNPSIKDESNRDLSHLIVLAKNYEGWKQLVSLVSESNRPEYFYHKPRLDLDTLSKFVKDNIICIVGHIGSVLADDLILEDKINPEWLNIGKEKIQELKNIFGDNLFLESQLIDKENLPIQIELVSCIRELGKLTTTKVVCTPDAHYCCKEDAMDQRVLLCNNLKTTFSEVSRKITNNEKFSLSCFFLSDNYHIPSPAEMFELHTPEEIENTNYVASIIEEYNILNRPKLPKYTCPNNISPDEYLRELCREGWKNKIAKKIPKESQEVYLERIKKELEVLQGAGLSSYFLIVQDIVNYVRNNGWLPGPGRGSASGCLVSYLIGITSIDPIAYNLIFERFYSAGRNTKDHISLPDIDVDVPILKREEVISYIKNKYGHENVSQMITFNTMKGRGALKDVLRVYGNISFEEMNKITENIPDEAKISDDLQEMKEETGESSIIRWALENNSEKLKEWCFIDEEDGSLKGPLAKRFEQAIRLEGTKTNQSKHAAGIAMSSIKLNEICPMVYDTKTSQPIAGMEMQDLEAIGIVKFDILGIALLDKIMTISSLLFQGVSL